MKWFVAITVACVLGLVVSLGGVWVHALVTPPGSISAAESELQHDILFYEKWDGIPYIVVEFDERIIFDELIVDPISMGWPQLPQWQWSGWWSYLDVTSDPASVAISDFPIRNVLFGQVNGPAIVALELEFRGEADVYVVAAPAFAVQSQRPVPVGVTVRWLNASGEVVWTGEVEDG